MDAKEKGKELVNKMYVNQWRSNTMEYKTAKQCALIANQEVLDVAFMFNNQELITYYLEVKEEIEKL